MCLRPTQNGLSNSRTMHSVLNIVVGQLLAVELSGKSQRIGHLLPLAVEFGRLVGVFAVAQRLHEVELEEKLLVQTRLRAHIGGDHRVVLGGMRIGFGRELQARGLFGIAAGANLVQNRVIVRGVAHHRHVGPSEASKVRRCRCSRWRPPSSRRVSKSSPGTDKGSHRPCR
jgi:hypothetical protein